MLPVTPTTSGEKRRRHSAATAWRPRSVSGTATIATSGAPEAAGPPQRRGHGIGRGGRFAVQDQQGRGTGRHGRADEAMAVGLLAGQGNEQIARLHQPRVHGTAANRAGGWTDKAPAGGGGDLGWLSGQAAPHRAEDPIGGCRSRPQCRTANRAGCGSEPSRHPSGLRLLTGGRRRAGLVRRDLESDHRVGGDAPEQLGRLDRHRQDALSRPWSACRDR